MPIPPLELKRVERKLAAYCDKKVPPEVRDRIVLKVEVKGMAVTLSESRPMFSDPSKWIDIPVARFRYNKTSGEWMLYYRDRNRRWHEYWDFEPTRNFDRLLGEVEADPTGIFWG